MLFDRLRESKYAQSDDLINPLTLVKIGGADYKPSPADLDAWRQVFEEASYDKNFKIFTHDALTVERVGANSGIIDISGDVTQCIKEIYTGLMVPQVLMDGGSDTTYANGTVALDVLRQRYMQFRNMLASWLKRKIFAPISKVNEFYDYVDKEKVLIVPEIDFNHMSLFDVDSYITQLTNLAAPQSSDTKPKISLHTLYRSLGLEWEDEQRKMKMEAIDAAILAKEEEALAKMPLNELRALDESSEIKEQEDSAVPGEEVEKLPGEDNETLPGAPSSPSPLAPPKK